MRRLPGVVIAGVALVLAGCSSSGDVSQATVILGESDTLSRADLKGAADAVITYFHGFENCTLLKLTYDEAFSERQVEITGPDGPQLPEGGDVVVFDSSWVDRNPIPDENSTWEGWTWWVVRADGSHGWTVINYGVA